MDFRRFNKYHRLDGNISLMDKNLPQIGLSVFGLGDYDLFRFHGSNIQKRIDNSIENMPEHENDNKIRNYDMVLDAEFGTPDTPERVVAEEQAFALYSITFDPN